VPFSCQTGVFIKIVNRTQAKAIPPSLPAMLSRIVDHVAPLAERSKVHCGIVAWVMVKVRASKHDIGNPNRSEGNAAFNLNPFAMIRTPATYLRIPPASVT
jgi:S-ribosylhomocysteine lyase LuxS involved in autoinducer biosynthesis